MLGNKANFSMLEEDKADAAACAVHPERAEHPYLESGTIEGSVPLFQRNGRRCCCCCCCKTKRSILVCAAVSVLLLGLSTLVIFLTRDQNFFSRRVWHGVFGYSLRKHDAEGRPFYRVGFIGDSLVQRSDMEHNVIHHTLQRLQSDYPEYHFEGLEAGIGGNVLSKIKSRLWHDVLRHEPDSVVLYWDSDASDVPMEDDTPATRAAYRTDLGSVLSDVAAATGSRALVGGPTFWGEFPRGTGERDAM